VWVGVGGMDVGVGVVGCGCGWVGVGGRVWASVDVGVHVLQLWMKCSHTQVVGGDVAVGVWFWVVGGMRTVNLSINTLYILQFAKSMTIWLSGLSVGSFLAQTLGSGSNPTEISYRTFDSEILKNCFFCKNLKFSDFHNFEKIDLII